MIENKAIILVPSSFIPGNICKQNAVKFIHEAEYKVVEKDAKTDIKTTFVKSINGKDINFEVHDSVRGLSKDDWKRVVAVFVNGSEWEFRDWPKGENTLSIFLKIKGFYMKYSDLPTPPNVLKWNVKILNCFF